MWSNFYFPFTVIGWYHDIRTHGVLHWYSTSGGYFNHGQCSGSKFRTVVSFQFQFGGSSQFWKCQNFWNKSSNWKRLPKKSFHWLIQLGIDIKHHQERGQNQYIPNLEGNNISSWICLSNVFYQQRFQFKSWCETVAGKRYWFSF